MSKTVATPTRVLDLAPILEAKHRHNWIIIFGDTGKSPEICGPWKLTHQTDEELTQLYEKVKTHAYNWGPITGNGLIAFDFDWPWVFGLWIEHFKPRADTLIIETPNGGARVFYHTTELSPGDPFKETLHLEIKTSHYVAAGGEALTQDSDLKLYKVARDQPIKTDNEILQDAAQYLDELLEGKYNWINYHCIDNYLSKCKKRIVLPHPSGLAIANLMISGGCEDWELHNFRKSVWDFRDNKYIPEYDEKKTQKQIDSTHQFLEKGGKPPTCRTLLTNFKQDETICRGCPRKKAATTKFVFKTIDYVKDLIAKTRLKTIETSTNADTIWRYNEDRGIWLEDGIPYIEKNLRDLLGAKLKPHHLTEVIKITKVYTYVKPEEFIEDPNSISLQNGEYDFVAGTLIPFEPEHSHKNQIPIKYDPNAKCPETEKFITEILPGDEQLIQEWLGYHLTKLYIYHNYLILVGSGANGKSTLINLIRRWLGPENCSTQTLFMICNSRFSTAELYGKLANIAPDISPDELRRTGMLKALTGGDPITAEKKNRDPFTFRSYAKLTFSCNQLPTTPDTSNAFFRRPIILTCNQVFEGDKRDVKKLDKLTTPQELSGLLNLAMEGLKRLKEKGDFTGAKNTIETQELYQRMADPLNAFTKDCLTEDPEAKTPKTEIYQAYAKYCKKRSYVPITDNVFARRLATMIPAQSTSITVEKQRVNAWGGIALRCEGREGEGCEGCEGSVTPPEKKQTKIKEEEKEEKKDGGEGTLPSLPSLADESPPSPNLREKLEAVMRATSLPVSMDYIAGKCGLESGEAEKLLGVLEREKRVFRVPGSDLWRRAL